MKQFDVPSKYQSSIIKSIKAKQLILDPRKQKFSPFEINLGNLTLIFPRHFGFCYGVENAIEIAYKAITENPDKHVFLLSELIHNSAVNEDLKDLGAKFIFNDLGEQIIAWDKLSKADIVITPAFGTTKSIEIILKQIGVNQLAYNSTCPFVEKVWKKAATLNSDGHTVIIHGKYEHPETKATFSQTKGKALVIKNLDEAKILGNIMLGRKKIHDFYTFFKEKFSEGFDPQIDLNKIGVVNQTTMLASETQEIADYFKFILTQKHGAANIKQHYADTRDTLCYATNNNQKSNLELLKIQSDFALVIGGYNSSNTQHLYQILKSKHPTYYIQNIENIQNSSTLSHFNFKKQTTQTTKNYLPSKRPLKIIISSGASCPDSIIDQIIEQLLLFTAVDRLVLKNALK